MNSVLSSDLLSTAPIAAIAIAMIGFVIDRGFRRVADPSLPLADRKLVGRFVLIGWVIVVPSIVGVTALTVMFSDGKPAYSTKNQAAVLRPVPQDPTAPKAPPHTPP